MSDNELEDYQLPKSLVNHRGQLYRLIDGKYCLDETAPSLKYKSLNSSNYTLTQEDQIYSINDGIILNAGHKIIQMEFIDLDGGILLSITADHKLIAIYVGDPKNISVVIIRKGKRLIGNNPIFLIDRDVYLIVFRRTYFLERCSIQFDALNITQEEILSGLNLALVDRSGIYRIAYCGVGYFKKTYLRSQRSSEGYVDHQVINAYGLPDSVIMLHSNGNLYFANAETSICDQNQVFCDLTEEIPFIDMLDIDSETHLINKLGQVYHIRKYGGGCDLILTDIPEFIFKRESNIKNARS